MAANKKNKFLIDKYEKNITMGFKDSKHPEQIPETSNTETTEGNNPRPAGLLNASPSPWRPTGEPARREPPDRSSSNGQQGVKYAFIR